MPARRACSRQPRDLAAGGRAGHEIGRGKARARDDRLEIAGQQSLGLAQAPDAHRLKVLLEEAARGLGILRLQACGLAADARQRAGKLCALIAASDLQERLAARLIGSERGEMIVGGPARKLAPFHRLELAAGKFRRPFGPCRGGYEA